MAVLEDAVVLVWVVWLGGLSTLLLPFFFGAPFGQGVSVEDCMIDSLSCGDV